MCLCYGIVFVAFDVQISLGSLALFTFLCVIPLPLSPPYLFSDLNNFKRGKTFNLIIDVTLKCCKIRSKEHCLDSLILIKF
jgi:hypothetical protein